MPNEINNQMGLQKMREALSDVVAKTERGEVDAIMIVGLTRLDSQSDTPIKVGHTFMATEFDCDIVLPILVDMAIKCAADMHSIRCRQCREVKISESKATSS